MTFRIKNLSSKIKHKISPTHVSINNKVVSQNKLSEPKNLQVIKAKLAQNALVELRLGFDEVEFYSRHDIQSLIHVIKDQFLYRLSLDKHSCLKSIKIGWKLPSFAVGPILQQVIPMLLQEPIRITHIQLAMQNTPIPESCLKRIVSWPPLHSLDIRSIRVMRPLAMSERPATAYTSPSSRSSSFSYTHGSTTTGSFNNRDNSSGQFQEFSPHSWKSENIVSIVPHVSLSVKTLKLVDCGLRNHHVYELCKIIGRKMHGLQELSLRHNRDLGDGFGHLLSLPCIKKLDLSLCDLDPHDGIRIARAMEKYLKCGGETTKGNNNHHLQKLTLAGNYRMAETIPDIVRAASCRLVELDCSFCDVQSKIQRQVFSILASTPNCTLKSYSMQGTRINGVNELLACINCNTSLRRLVLDHPRDPFPVPLVTMERIAEAMKSNYSLCTLRIDTYRCEKVWHKMEFWFELNQCGRRILLQSNDEQRTSAWSSILATAVESGDANVIFWLLKHGSSVFAS
ncbi:hypothetical protein IV203_029913 [Nitzschia inconspicua]|uniref:Uncharacterized protein n=1 Tax=Nitzschia inconspicua TaxID=303405 RepID=A0A9K3Q0T7_9STRA|nr:hypothetical protein IV203_029913 [Nitzschia inconspicua]